MTSTTAAHAPTLRRLADLPSPAGLPLLGHLHRLPPSRMHLAMERWAAELGTPYRLNLGGRPLVVIDDPEQAQALLRDRPAGVRRARMLRPVFVDMGLDGLFSTEGEAWLPQRKLIMQSLNATHFKAFFPTLQSITERLYRRWRHAAESGQVVEMTQDLIRYTVDVTSAMAFGEDPNTLEQSGNVIQDHLASIFPMVMKRTLMPWPYWHWFKLPADRRLDRDLAAVHAYAHERVARARARRLAQPAEAPRNALEAMLAQADRPDSGFSDDLIVANVLTLLLGGEDTTAHGLAWTMLYLAQDPALQQRLHADALRLQGSAAVCPTHEAVRTLDDFEALATEAMRLRPVAAFLALEALRDMALGDLAVPRGTQIFVLHRPPQLSPRHFHEPMRYDPGRWTRERLPGRAHDPRAYLQFGAGPRVCPGRHLAAVELRLVLAMLMRHFELELACDPASIREVLHFTLMPERMPVRLKLRPQAAPTAASPPAAARCPFGHTA